jgi:hypothetical protein
VRHEIAWHAMQRIRRESPLAFPWPTDEDMDAAIKAVIVERKSLRQRLAALTGANDELDLYGSPH